MGILTRDSGMHAAGYLFRQFLSGNITYHSDGSFVDVGEILQSNLIGSTEPEPIFDDLGAALERRFDDLFLSMISDTQLHSQINASISCSVTESVLVWNYEPFWLALSYILAVSLTSIAITIGGYCFYKNGYPVNISFSSIIATTRSTDLDSIIEGHLRGRWPMSKDILDSRLMFGEVGSPTQGRSHVAFAFPEHVRQMEAWREYP